MYYGRVSAEGKEYEFDYATAGFVVLKTFVDESPVKIDIKDENELANSLVDSFKAENTISVKYFNRSQNTATEDYEVRTTLIFKGKAYYTVVE